MATDNNSAVDVPTQFMEAANGIRYAYRRFGKSGAVPLILMQQMREREEEEFRQKKERVFYRPFLENTMQSTFYRQRIPSSFEQLSFPQQVAAQLQFGAIVRDYLGTSYSVRNTLIDYGI
jgi:hypothetical protein